jgi:hypothetical protein
VTVEEMAAAKAAAAKAEEAQEADAKAEQRCSRDHVR